MSASDGTIDAPSRARAWLSAGRAAVCDVVEPWEHGTVRRATRHPNYYDLNAVRVEEDPIGMSAADLAAFADDALAGLAHRRVDFDVADAGEARRAQFEALGWKTTRLLWMRHEASPADGPAAEAGAVMVEAVPYDAVAALRDAWHREDFPGQDPAAYHAEAREVAHELDVEVLAVREGDDPIAFAQLERRDGGAEITQVYVHPAHRGGGRGTAMTRAAIEAAKDADDLWIVADDEGRPKELYARLGFRPAWTMLEFLRLP